MSVFCAEVESQMLREFFVSSNMGVRVWAWSGLAFIVGHAFLRAYVKKLLNDWMGRFYDLGGAASEVSSGDTYSLSQGQTHVTALLLEFGVLCIPNVLVHPVFKLVSNRWVLSWRLSLVDSYIERWDSSSGVIEGAAQRIHEDTSRFARGIQTCVVVLLDSVLTVVVFGPILVDLGAHIKPVKMPDCWILMVCIGVAFIGIIFSLLLGWSLIELEVNNQRVEAEVRKKLVIREERLATGEVPSIERNFAFVDVDTKDFAAHFKKTVSDLRFNYVKLYYRFACFSVWLGSYEQTVILLPYMLTGPLLYSSSNRITLGTVTRASHSFANLFDALNILSDRWLDVTDFLSVIRRLKEFEAHMSEPSRVKSSLIVGVEMSSSTQL